MMLKTRLSWCNSKEHSFLYLFITFVALVPNLTTSNAARWYQPRKYVVELLGSRDEVLAAPSEFWLC